MIAISSVTPKTILCGLALLAAFTTGLACGNLTDALNEEECLSNADCGGGLTCVQPVPMSSNGGTAPQNGIGLGWCLEGSQCVPGVQPFCPCTLSANNEPSCVVPLDTQSRMVKSIEICQNPNVFADCWCVPSGACPFDEEENP